MRYRYLLADVFTDRRFGGNPLAVFPHGQGLDDATMQSVARELNLSETVFVLPPENPAHTFRLRIFTPLAELPFAGHPTIGSAFLLALDGHIPLHGATTPIVFEEGVGPVPVTIHARDGVPGFAQLSVAQLPEFGDSAPSPETLAAVLSLPVDALGCGDWSAQVVSCGVPYLLVPVCDREALRSARFDVSQAEKRLAGFPVRQLYVFTAMADSAGVNVSARMFAPELGVFEDPATGSAAAALAGYLAHADDSGAISLSWRVEQGIDMGRPSRIDIEADKHGAAITAIRVGGESVLIGEGVLELPAA